MRILTKIQMNSQLHLTMCVLLDVTIFGAAMEAVMTIALYTSVPSALPQAQSYVFVCSAIVKVVTNATNISW